MAVTNPIWIQAETYQAVDARLALTAQLAPATPNATTLTRPGGVIPGFAGMLAVTQTTTASLSVNIAAGAASVPASSSTGGNYLLVNNAPVTVTHSAGSASGPRVDLVIARVYDTGSDIPLPGVIEVVAGTVNGGAPSMPAGGNALKLAEVTVGPGTSAVITQNKITPSQLWAVGAGGVLPAVSTARPANPYGGMAIWETDTNQLSLYSASAATWRSISTETTGAWSTYTPAWTATGVNPTNGDNGSINGRYIKIGKTVHFTITLTVSGVNLGVGTGDYALSLPPDLPAASGTNARWACNALWFDQTGDGATEASKFWPGTGIILAGGTTISQFRLAVAEPGTATKGGRWGAAVPAPPQSQDQMTVSGTYETSA
jgi:hypothetical protein